MSIVTVYSPPGCSPRRAVTAEANRALLADAGVRAVHLVGGPGCGKTTLIDATISRLKPGGVRCAAIVCAAGPGCDATVLNHLHLPIVRLELRPDDGLDPDLFREALLRLDLASLDLILTEMVGSYEGRPTAVGQERTAALFSVAAGDDKPAKHPAMAAAADAIVLGKSDLLPFVPFDCGRFHAALGRMAPELPCFQLSAKTGEGLDPWVEWLGLRRPPAPPASGPRAKTRRAAKA